MGGMVLSTAQAYDLLGRHGAFAREACDRCGVILATVRYTRRGESGVWCSRQCRGDGEQHAIRKGGRPKKYKTDAQRQRAKREQGTVRQGIFRASVCNGKPPLQLPGNKALAGANLASLALYPYQVPSSSRNEAKQRQTSVLLTRLRRSVTMRKLNL